MTWRDEAACLGADPDLFFPDETVRVSPKGRLAYDRQVAEAVEVCGRCPVTAECLADALGLGDRDVAGIRAGLTAQERVPLRVPTPQPRRRPVECRHGHIGEYKEDSRGRWRCMVCTREASARSRQRASGAA